MTMVNEYNSMGLAGIKEISGTDAITPDSGKLFGAFVAINGDAVIDNITFDGKTITTNITIKDGFTILIPYCSSIELASGYGWAYNMV